MAAVAEMRGKARQILEGARAVFLESGYEGASTDEIARRAQVSKGTLYKYYPDKRTLFLAVIEDECRRQAENALDIDPRSADTEATLRQVARRVVRALLSPRPQEIFRLVIAESERFPEMSRAFYFAGPDRGQRRLSQFLAGAVARGDLDIADIDLAACQLDELCKADLFTRALFGALDSVTEADMDRVADAAADTFLRAYRPAA